MTITSILLMSGLKPVALNYTRIKRENAVITGGVFGVNYPLNSEHKERATQERAPGVFNGVLRFYISHLTFHLQAIMNFPAMFNQCYRSPLLGLY